MSNALIDCRTGYRVPFDTRLARSRQSHRLRARATRVVSQQSASEVVVVGAGAAGLTAAYFAASQGAQVLITCQTLTSVWIVGHLHCSLQTSCQMPAPLHW